MRPRIGITLGDPAGIGPEVIEQALTGARFDAELRVIGHATGAAPGRPTKESARVALGAMEEAARLANAGEISAVVTGPIHKARLAEIGFSFPGQTEFFAARSCVTNYAMLLTANAITVALVTTHLPLREVAEALKPSEIVRIGKLLAAFLRGRGHKNPRIAVAGLNPHAGESGRLGMEEIHIIAPAVGELRATSKGQDAASFEGPISPDALFFQLLQGRWDAALCMYHDQGLIPLKLHGFDQGVNVTLGLPYPRTSPDHGTAFDIAGKDIARPDSMIAAINLAIELARYSI